MGERRRVHAGLLRLSAFRAALSRFTLTVLLVLLPGFIRLPAAATGAAAGAEGVLEGVVLEGGQGRGGVLVEVHLQGRDEGRASPEAAVTTGPDGKFALHLAPGAYYLSVREAAVPPRPPRILDYDGNPVSVKAGTSLTIGPFDLGAAGTGPAGTLLTGRLLYRGAPVPGAAVMIYAAGSGRPVGPTYVATVTSGSDGRFSLAAAPGAYSLVARKRMRGMAFGPPQPGDLSAEYGKNPLAVGDEDLEIGDLEMHEIDADRLSRRLRTLDNPEPSRTAIRGRVFDSDGKAVPGTFVFLYGDANMTGKPLFVTRSDAEGHFILNAPGRGEYFVVARSRYGAASQPGDLIGLVEGSEPSSVRVEEGSTRRDVILRLEQRW